MPTYTFEVSDPVIRAVRDKGPADFVFEIESYQELLNSASRTGSDRIETSEFSAGGYSWVLILYPAGNKKDRANDNVSLYVRLVNKPAGGGAVFASFKFFLFDSVREKYVTISDGKERKFDAAHLEWGLPQALSVAAFKDERNGLLVNNTCTLGAEIYVIKSTNTFTRLSLLEKETLRNTTWPVYDFSTLRTEQTHEFSVEGRTWKLRLFPRGNLTGQGTHLSLYLYSDDLVDLTGGRKLFVECTLSIRDLRTGDDFKKSVGFWFDANNKNRGFDTFLSLGEVNSPAKGYKQDNTIYIEANLNEMFTLQEIS